MASRAQDNSRIVSVRLPAELIRRLDRYLDWSETSGRVKFSRNAALREALRLWLDDQEQLAGFVSPETLRGQFRAANNCSGPRSAATPSWRGSAPMVMWSWRVQSPTRHTPPTPTIVTRCTVIAM